MILSTSASRNIPSIVRLAIFYRAAKIAYRSYRTRVRLKIRCVKYTHATTVNNSWIPKVYQKHKKFEDCTHPVLLAARARLAKSSANRVAAGLKLGRLWMNASALRRGARLRHVYIFASCRWACSRSGGRRSAAQLFFPSPSPLHPENWVNDATAAAAGAGFFFILFFSPLRIRVYHFVYRPVQYFTSVICIFNWEMSAGVTLDSFNLFLGVLERLRENDIFGLLRKCR